MRAEFFIKISPAEPPSRAVSAEFIGVVVGGGGGERRRAAEEEGREKPSRLGFSQLSGCTPLVPLPPLPSASHSPYAEKFHIGTYGIGREIRMDPNIFRWGISIRLDPLLSSYLSILSGLIRGVSFSPRQRSAHAPSLRLLLLRSPPKISRRSRFSLTSFRNNAYPIFAHTCIYTYLRKMRYNE